MSRILKASQIEHSSEKIVLEITTPPKLKTLQNDQRLQEEQISFEEMQRMQEEAKNIIQDAEEMARRIIEEAQQQAMMIQSQAQQEIEEWWQTKETEAVLLMEETRENAYQEGYQQGRQDGHHAVLDEEQSTIETAREVLTIAYAQKERIISEAEPFLVDLSMEIAKKVITQELATSEEKVLEIARKVLRRSRVHGQITLCVNHKYFDYMEEHRAQFLSLLDGQAELSIFPDYSVQDEGCVIRTPFGSVDARIDTQLTEIKQALLDIARGSDTSDLS